MKFTFNINIEKRHLIFLALILGVVALGFVFAAVIPASSPSHTDAQIDLGGGASLSDFASAIKTLPTTPATICTSLNTGDNNCIDASGSGADTRCDTLGTCTNVYATTGANLGSGTTIVTNLLLNGQVLNDLGVQGSLHVGASDANQGDINFYDEIKPDGNPCLVGQILKKTAANNWDCATDIDTDTQGSESYQTAGNSCVVVIKTSQADCPSGKKLVSGGGSCVSGEFLKYSRPLTGSTDLGGSTFSLQNSWIAGCYDSSYIIKTGTAYAVCCTTGV